MRSILTIFLLLTTVALLAQPVQKLVRSGNTDYKNGHYKDAEINYRKALTKAPESEKATFNLGNSLYKQNNYDEAASQYLKLAQSEKKVTSKANVYYNLGNSMFESKKYKESIDAYKMALRQNPKDEDTRYNLSYAMTKLQQQQKQEENKKQEEKQQQQKQQQQQQQPKPNMSKQDANRMLNAMNNNEKRTLDKTKNKQKTSNQSQLEKDW